MQQIDICKQGHFSLEANPTTVVPVIVTVDGHKFDLYGLIRDAKIAFLFQGEECLDSWFQYTDRIGTSRYSGLKCDRAHISIHTHVGMDFEADGPLRIVMRRIERLDHDGNEVDDPDVGMISFMIGEKDIFSQILRLTGMYVSLKLTLEEPEDTQEVV